MREGARNARVEAQQVMLRRQVPIAGRTRTLPVRRHAKQGERGKGVEGQALQFQGGDARRWTIDGFNGLS